MKKIAQFFSFIFSPLLIPTYAVFLALWTTVLVLSPASTRWIVVGVTFGITCLIPLVAIGIMAKLGMVSDPGLNKQNERTIPYVVTAVSYACCAYYLYFIHAPYWLYMFMVGALIANIISMVVNGWWKISAHMAAVGGLVGMVFRIIDTGVAIGPMILVLALSVLIAGIVGTSRLILERHTLWQVIAGTVNGFVCVYFISAIHF